MDSFNGNTELLELVGYPAFYVCDGNITQTNDAAKSLLITTDEPVASLIQTGLAEYLAMSEGCISLVITIHEQSFCAFVHRMENQDLFVLDLPQEDPVQMGLSLASATFRAPLHRILGAVESLQQMYKGKDADSEKLLAEISRGSFQILRQVANMSDAATYPTEKLHCQLWKPEETIREIVEKAGTALESKGIQLSFTSSCPDLIVPLNREKIERALHNLILNAANSIAPRKGHICVELSRSEDRLYISVTDDGRGIPDEIMSNIFCRYRRCPNLETVSHGIGLGLSLVRSVATAHGGTVLIQRCASNGTRIIMSLKIMQYSDMLLRAPRFHFDYAGEYDHTLVELSDILPSELFQ